MAGAVVVTTPCKVNLHLGVHREKDGRGYHRVDSVMVPVDLCDVVTVEEAPALSVRFEPALEVAPEKTGVWKAAVLLAEALGRQPGVSVSVACHIPERAGLGGSSADAGAAIRALCGLWGVDPLDSRVVAVARRVGADVAFFLNPEPGLYGGAGDVLERTFPAFEVPVALVMPCAEGGSTVAAYAEFDRAGAEPRGYDDLCSALEEMTRVEVAAREARIVRQRIRSSGFPYVKGLADFDWDFQPSVPRARIEELATLRFIERAENVLLVGSPGVGKTHLAVAIGIEAVRAGREVRFMDCARLVEDLQDAQARGILKKRLKYYAHSKLLVIDELGYLDIGEGGADLLFQLISTRYEQRSTIITTNVGIGGWGKVFGDDVAASAIADRVCHHCHVIKITGRSYRLKDLPRERRGTE